MKVADLMTREVYVCRVDEPLSCAAHIMWERDCGCVPVVNGEGRVIAMVTDRDICMAAHLQGRPLPEIPVSTAMSGTLYACHADDELAAAEELMRVNKIRRLPVVDAEGCVIGLLALNDLTREATRQRKGRKGVTLTQVVETLGVIGEPRAPLASAA